jgi:uncharacterized protein (UPF0261 family)
MMLRGNYENLGYKPMTLKHSESLGSPLSLAARRRRESNSRPSLGLTALGVVCVAAVFGLLGVLYSLG